MHNRLLSAMACGLSLVLLRPFLSEFTVPGAPVATIVPLAGSVIAIISGFLLLRAVLHQPNVAH